MPREDRSEIFVHSEGVWISATSPGSHLAALGQPEGACMYRLTTALQAVYTPRDTPMGAQAWVWSFVCDSKTFGNNLSIYSWVGLGPWMLGLTSSAPPGPPRAQLS